MFRIKKLTPPSSLGFAHYIVPILMVAVIAVVGGYVLLNGSSAATLTGAVYLESGVSGKCLDDAYDKATNGTKIQSYACNKSAAQAWELNTNGTIENANGKCIDNDYGKNLNDNPITVYTCSASNTAEQWKNTGSILKNPTTNKCIDLPYGTTKNGTALQLYTCNGKKQQSWSGVAVDTTGSESTALCTTKTSALAIHVCNGELVNGQDVAVQLRGVDIDGTDDACSDGAGFSWGASSTQAEDDTTVAALLSWHINVVRLPLDEDNWLDINGVPASCSGANYQSNLKAFVTTLNNAGIYTILDLHITAPSTVDAGWPNDWPMADSDHSVTFWSQVATAYKTDPAVIFDLYNEPYIGQSSTTTSSWSCLLNGCSDKTDAPETAPDYNLAGMQQLLDAVRAAGADQPALIGGLDYDTNPCASDGDSAQTCPQLSYMPTDKVSPSQMAVSWHTYGQETGTCVTTTCWNSLAATMKTAKIPIITGELGDEDDTSGGCSYVQPFIDWADQQSPKVSYLAWEWQTGTGQSGGTLDLITNWTGTPNPSSDGGTALRSHLLGDGDISCTK